MSYAAAAMNKVLNNIHYARHSNVIYGDQTLLNIIRHYFRDEIQSGELNIETLNRQQLENLVIEKSTIELENGEPHASSFPIQWYII